MKRRGFSLVEVVVAVGIFAIAIISIIGLLIPINNSVADIRDSEDASRIATNIQGELQKLSFAALKGALDFPPTDEDDIIYASRDGGIVEVGSPRSQSPARINAWDPSDTTTNRSGGERTALEEDALKFFKVELIRNDDLSPSGNDGTAGYLAFTIKLTWPAYATNGEPVSPSNQSSMLIPAAITR